jgi:hypothetical protein
VVVVRPLSLALFLGAGGLSALGQAGGSPVPAPGPQRADLSWDEADSLARKLADAERRMREGKRPAASPVLVTEGELNSYLNLSLGPKMPQGLTDLKVRLDSDRLFASALLDLGQVEGKIKDGGALRLFRMLGGPLPVELKGRMPNQDGFGQIEVDELRLGTFPVPMSLLEQIVTSSTRSADYPQGFDIHSPFRLPYALKRVRLQPGRALLDF